MAINKLILSGVLLAVFGLAGCSRQQSDWEKSRAANTTDAYELFLKKYPTGEFTAQAKARLNELYEERDWQRARDADTPDAYQAFLKQYPEGKWTEEARIRVENFTLAQTPNSDSAAASNNDGSAAPGNSMPQADATPAANMRPAAPAPAPAKARKPAMVAAAPGGSGNYAVQLGAFKASADAANKRWAELTRNNPKLFAGLSPKISPRKGVDGTLYRLQVANLSEKHAREICRSLQASSQACVLVAPSS